MIENRNNVSIVNVSVKVSSKVLDRLLFQSIALEYVTDSWRKMIYTGFLVNQANHETELMLMGLLNPADLSNENCFVTW